MTHKQARYAHNVRTLVWLQGLRTFYVSVPVYAPFILSNGLALGDIFLLRSAFALTVLVVDAPCGYFADQWGRRRCLLLGSALLFAGAMLFVLGESLGAFLVGEVLNGVSFGLFSGADTALLYDSLAAQERAGEYQRLESRATVLGRLGEGVASLVAAAILVWASPRWAFVVAAARAGVFTWLSFRLVEPPSQSPHQTGSRLRGFYRGWRTAFLEAASVRWLIVLSATIGAVAISSMWLTQTLFVERLPEAQGWLPILLLACHVSGALLTTVISPRVPGHLVPLALLGLLVVLCGIHAVMGLNAAAWVVLGAIPFQLHWSRMPMVQRLIMDQVAPGQRVTVLSWLSVLTRALEVILTLAIAGLVTRQGASAGFLLTAGVLGTLGVLGALTRPRLESRRQALAGQPEPTR